MSPHAPGITSASFPTPHLLIRVSSGQVPPSIGSFAVLQARQATRLLQGLRRRLPGAVDPRRRIAVFTAAFNAAEQWRCRLAASQPQSDGRYSVAHTRRFCSRIKDAEPNYIPIGEPARYCDGATWDDASGRYVGGTSTPASRTMSRYLGLARDRFTDATNDVVVDRVFLPDGSVGNGMRLLRGAAAARAGDVIAARIAARGGDTSRCFPHDELVYVASASEAERRVIFRGAMAYLAQGDAASTVAWTQAAYLLYQAPQRRRGSDATIRTLLVAAGTYLFGRPPHLPHDLDLLAYVHTQDDFVRVLRPSTLQGV